MSKKKKIVIIGATSAIAEHCARLMAEKEAIELMLLGRNHSRLEHVAADLHVRSPHSDIQTLCVEFLDPVAIQKTVDRIVQEGPVDLIFIAHGSFPLQQDCQNNLSLCSETLAINGISPVLYAEAFASALEKANHGTLVVIGSVAGDRGRKTNYTYGSAKSLVKSYMQGLQHRFYGTKVNIILINPGPTDTPMTARYKSQGMKMASVEEVSAKIIDAIEHKKSVAYVPAKWQSIMWVVRHLPDCVFNRLNI